MILKSNLKLTQPFAQTVLMLFTSIALILLTLKPLKTFKNLDPSSKLSEFKPSELNKLTPITTGFYLRNFIEFDIVKNDFVAEGILWFSYDPKKISLDEISKFSFSKGEFIKGETLSSKNDTAVKVLSEDKHLALFNIRLKFSSNLNYRLFPLDDHTLYLTFNNKYISADKFYFKADKNNFFVSDTNYTFGWNNISNNVKSGYTEIILDKSDDQKNFKFPRVIFSLDFIGSSFRNIFLIFMPLFVALFLSLFLYSFDPEKYRDTIMSLSAATVPAMLGYRYVIESISPKVAYFMLSDQIFNLFLILAFMIFFINTFYLQKLKEYRGFIIIGFHVILIFSWYYILYVWGS